MFEPNENAERELDSSYLEQYVMVNCSINAQLIERMLLKAKPEYFKVYGFHQLFSGLKAAFDKSSDVDFWFVFEDLVNRNKFARENAIQALTNSNIYSCSRFDEYLDRLCDIGQRRATIKKVNTLVTHAGEMDSFQFHAELANCAKDFDPVVHKTDKRYVLGRITDPTIERKVVPFGFPSLDSALGGGGGAGDLIIIAGRPGMGKTAFALSLCIKAAKGGKRGLFITLEMSEEQLLTRVLSQESGFAYRQIANHQIHDSRKEYFEMCLNDVANMKLDIIDKPSMTVSELRGLVKADKPDFVVLDYLQLLTPENGRINRSEQVAQQSRTLKLIAKENRIPVIALSQLKREEPGLKSWSRPKLSDLKESGAIEQDADGVWFVHRDAYYDKEMRTELQDSVLIIGKQRNGEVVDIPLQFNARSMKFAEPRN